MTTWLLTKEERAEVNDLLPAKATVGEERQAYCRAQARKILEGLDCIDRASDNAVALARAVSKAMAELRAEIEGVKE